MTHGRQELASGLRGLIARAEVTPAEVSRRIGVAESTVSRYLGGRVAVSPATVRRIITACDARADPEADALEQLAEDVHAGSASRVVILRSGAATSQRRFGKLEEAAEHVATFTALMVPGLLQTERYMRALFATGGRTGKALEDSVTGRLERQEKMRTSSIRYTQVTTEGALRWQVQSRGLMLEQAEHIADLARAAMEPRVRIGIIPWTVPVDLFPLTNFDLYDDTRAVIVGTNFGTSFLERSQDVAVYTRQLEQLEQLAVFGPAAALELERIAEDYRQR